MSETKDGGAAFPVLPPCDGLSAGEAAGYPAPETGMSLRDWFAGQALAICYRRFMLGDDPTPEDLALQAYFIADAMLAARAARTGEAGKDPRDDDIAVLLAEIDAARAMDDTLWDDPEDIALIEQIRAGLKARIGEAA